MAPSLKQFGTFTGLPLLFNSEENFFHGIDKNRWRIWEQQQQQQQQAINTYQLELNNYIEKLNNKIIDAMGMEPPHLITLENYNKHDENIKKCYWDYYERTGIKANI